jgi:hypothetical protein
MKKAAILAVLTGLLTLGIASTAGSAGAHSGSAAASSGDREALHLLTFNRALNGASKVARRECENNTSGPFTGSVCFAFQAGPGSFSSFKHKFTIPIHNVSGTPGTDPATWIDCHRNVKILIKKRFGKKLFFRFVSPWVCGPNSEHTTFSASRGALAGTVGG